VNVLLDTNMLSEPMRERPDAVVMAELEQGGHSLQTASLVIHELSYGIQRLADGRRKERFSSYLQNLLSSGLPVLAYDQLRRSGMANSALALRHVDCVLPLLVTRNTSDFAAFDGLQLLNWFSSP